MSSFTALNVTSNDNPDESKDHSRELQIEESSKVFQAALSHLKAKRFDEAKSKFDQLFEIKVIRPNKWGFYEYSSPTLDSLRYLAYRNRGIMYYQYVKEYFHELDAGDIVDHILKTLEDLLEALQHGDGDSTVTRLLVYIFESFNSKKLTRSILEHELAKFPEEQELWPSLSAMFKEQKQVFKRYSQVIASLRTNDLDANVPANLTRLLNYVRSCDIKIDEPNEVLKLIKDMKLQDDEMVRTLDGLDIPLSEATWEEIAIVMKGVLPKYKVLNTLGRVPDSYSELDGPIEYIKFQIQQNENNNNDLVCDKNVLGSKEDNKSTTTDDVKPDLVERSGTTLEKKISEQQSNEMKRNDADERPTQRSSKRFKEKENTQDNDSELLINFHADLFETIKFHLDLMDINTDLSLKNIDPDAPNANIPLFISDFYDCLSSWTNKHTEFLKQGQAQHQNSVKGTSDELTQLTMLLRTSMFFGDIEPTASLGEVEEKDVLSFIAEVNEKKLHFHAARVLFLKHMLSQTSDGKCLIIDYFWSPSLYETVEAFSVAMEANLFEMVELNSEIQITSIAISIFEILVNLFGTVSNEILSKKSQGQKISELENQKNKLERKILRWYHMLQTKELNEKLSLRFEWVHFCYLQYMADITSPDVLLTMENIEARLGNKVHFDSITFSNYVNIPSLSIKTVKSQFSKIKMLRRFTFIDTVDTNDSSNLDHVENLYCILNNIEGTGNDYLAMLDFVNSSPFMMKLKLWRMVMNQYTNTRNYRKFQTCYFNVLNFLYKRLDSREYQEQSQLQRQQTLLSILGHIGEFSKQYFDLISRDWKVMESLSIFDIKTLVSIFTLLYPLVFYESLVQRDGNLKSFFRKAVKSSNTLKDIFISIISLLIMYLNLSIRRKFDGQDNADQLIIRMISEFHALAGKFEMCDSFQRKFLQVVEEILCHIYTEESFMQLKLVLWCRYHIAVGSESSEQQHTTKECPMEKENAIILSNYFIKLQYADRNPLKINTGRSSFKSFFETVMDIVGEVEFDSNHVLSRNQFFLEQYFKAPITTKSIRDAYAGNLDLEFTSPNDAIQVGVNGGLFFVSSVHALNQYKSRKKLMQARPSELDAIISTLKTDILYNTKRFETWFLLGRCYSYVVEDDLTWTSDKLTSKDKKQATAFTEKKAILCYLMSLSLYFSQDILSSSKPTKEDRQQIFRDLLEALGEEMIQAFLKPMDCMAFVHKPKPLLRLQPDGKIENIELLEKTTISETNIRRCILIVLEKADKLYNPDTRNWINPFYIAKLHLKNDPSLFRTSGIILLKESCQLSMFQSSSSAGDLILESHYTLVTACYKCFKRNVFSMDEAIGHLKSDNAFFEKKDNEWEIQTTTDFYNLIIDLLRTILLKDKKKWHHRPTYRIAQIQYKEFGNIDGAMDEMQKLLALKSVNKNVVNIWKPDHERPGKHFVYAYQYIMFYMNLLNEKKDYMSIGLMIKKLRRFGSGMINSSETINRAAELFVQGAIIDLKINEKEDGELIMQSIPFPEFVKTSETLLENFKKEHFDSKVFDVFTLAYNLKKGTNSIQFDVVCITIYFKFFYNSFANKNKTPIVNDLQITNSSLGTQSNHSFPQHPDLPAPSDSKQIKTASKNQGTARKRVSKKDVFDRINKLMDKKSN